MFGSLTNLSLAHGKESLVVMFYLMCVLLLGPLSLTTLVYLLVYTQYWWISVAYCTWWFWDLQTINTGGRNNALVPWVRSWKLWKTFRDYFPIKLVKTAPLDPSKNYIICSHPHGVICFGAACCFASEAEEFSIKYPGISPHLTTIEGNLWWPMFREFFLCFGSVSSSRESIRHLLSTPGGGQAPVIMVGGVPEMDNYRRDEVKLVLRKRKGFVKMALRHGASLVPSFAFGEAGTYRQAGGLANSFHHSVKKFLGMAPVIFYGRGWLQNTFGILPERKPITVVVGKPIDVEKNENPTYDEIEDLHDEYMIELKNLYLKYNLKYGDPSIKLIIT